MSRFRKQFSIQRFEMIVNKNVIHLQQNIYSMEYLHIFHLLVAQQMRFCSPVQPNGKLHKWHFCRYIGPPLATTS